MLTAPPVAASSQTGVQLPSQAATTSLPASPAEPLSGTARLNAEQAAKSRREAEDYEARVRAVQQVNERGQEEFAVRTEIYEDDKARAAREAAEARLKWEADVIACQAGDKTRCGTAEPMHMPR